MKKFVLSVLFIFCSISLFSQEAVDSTEENENSIEATITESQDESVEVENENLTEDETQVESTEDENSDSELIETVPSEIELAIINEPEKKVSPLWFDILFTEGASYGQLTRIEKINNRSNFVKETFLAGAFFNIQTVNFWKLDFELQLGIYYPFYNTFNGMKQKARNMFNYAFDLYFGVLYSIPYIKYVIIDVSAGLHYMYQLTDEYHMNYVGIGTLDSIRLPVSSRWSIVNNYFFSFDNPNLGSNKNIQPFTGSYQYHIDLGMRYSRRVFNDYSYVK